MATFPLYRLSFLIVFGFNALFSRSQQFQDMTSSWGINHSFTGTDYGSGVTVYDWNEDGWDDVVLCRNNQAPMFLQNNGGSYSQIVPPVPAFGNSKMLTFADYDNDGDPDICVTVYSGQTRLFRNDGGMFFLEVTLAAGISQLTYLSFGHNWGDYDLDGDIDLYISNYNGPFFPNPTFTNLMYRNNGDGTFTDMSLETGLDNGSNYTFMSTWCDINNDYLPDLLVTNDRYTSKNYLYKNLGGGQFEEIGESAGVDQYIFSMCATQGDVQRDGLIDFYITNGTDGNLLLLNNGNETFTESAADYGVVLNTFNWGSNLVDFDNDTWDDLYINSTPHMAIPGNNRFFKNINGEYFNETSFEAGFDDSDFFNHSSAVGDFNNNGLYDIVSTRQTPGTTRFFNNVTETDNSYVKVTLEGVNSNRDGIGSWIIVYADGLSVRQYTTAGEGYLGQNSQHYILGLGEAQMIDSIEVIWPGGFIDTYFDLPVNQHFDFIEGNSLQTDISVVGPEIVCIGDTLWLSADFGDSHSWNTGESSQVIGVTEPGFYSVTVILNGFEVMSNPIEAEFYSLPQISSSVADAVCFGESSGQIELFNMGGTGTSSVVWFPEGEGEFLTDLPAGLYQYTYIDSNNCQLLAELEVGQPAQVQFQATVTDLQCFGDSSGVIVLNNLSGSGIVNVVWHPEAFGPELTGLAAGMYSFAATDLDGCQVYGEVEVLQSDSLNLNVDLFLANEISCLHQWAGNVIIDGGNGPYDVVWEFYIDDVLTETATGLNWECIGGGAPLNMVLTVSDSIGCVAVVQEFLDSIIGVEEYSSPVGQCFPNPVLSGSALTTQVNLFTTIEIFNHCGSVVWVEDVVPGQVIVQANWPRGMYFVRMTDQQGSNVFKLLVE